MAKVNAVHLAPERGLNREEIAGATVGEVLTAFCERHPDLRPYVFDGHGRLAILFSVYVNGEEIQYLNGLATALDASGQITLIPDDD